MKIIPVIDLKDGLVVHAKQGQRDRYRPIHSPLCVSADIEQVLDAFLQIDAFDTFYIADLNALGHQGNHDVLLENLLRKHSDKTFWIDRGFRPSDWKGTLPHNHVPVVGSESIAAGQTASLSKHRERMILSLDFATSGPLGCATLFEDPGIWPETVVIMTLAQVGSGFGPNLPLLAHYCRSYPHTRFVAAGGVRNRRDLIDLRRIGVERALVASALHSRAIGQKEIFELKANCAAED